MHLPRPLTALWIPLAACQAGITELGPGTEQDAGGALADGAASTPDAGLAQTGDASLLIPDAGSFGERRLTQGPFSVNQASMAYDRDGYRLVFVARDGQGVDRLNFGLLDREGAWTTPAIEIHQGMLDASITRGSLTASRLAWQSDGLRVQELSSARPVLDLSGATIGFARRWQLFDASFGGVLIFGDLGSDRLRHLHLEPTGASFVSDIASDIATDSVVSHCCLWGDRQAYVVGRSTDRSQAGLSLAVLRSWEGATLGTYALPMPGSEPVAHRIAGTDELFLLWSAPRLDNPRRSALYLSVLASSGGPETARITVAESASWMTPVADLRVTPSAVAVAWLGSGDLGGYNSVPEYARIDRRTLSVDRCVLSAEQNWGDHAAWVIMLDGPPETDEVAAIWVDVRDRSAGEAPHVPQDQLFFRKLAEGHCR